MDEQRLELRSLRKLKKIWDVSSEENPYMILQNIAKEVLNHFSADKGKCLPVDIRGIIQDAEIELYEMNLNMDTGFQIEKIKGFLRYRENGKWAIYIENNESEFTKRYVMAHEFSHYLINLCIRDIQSQDSTGDQQCVDPLFSKRRSEMYADIMAAYIMFPYQAVLECMKNYVMDMKTRNEYPIDGFEWMRVLGQRAQISPYFTISSYQHLKQFLCEYAITDRTILNEYGELFR